MRTRAIRLVGRGWRRRLRWRPGLRRRLRRLRRRDVCPVLSSVCHSCDWTSGRSRSKRADRGKCTSRPPSLDTPSSPTKGTLLPWFMWMSGCRCRAETRSTCTWCPARVPAFRRTRRPAFSSGDGTLITRSSFSFRSLSKPGTLKGRGSIPARLNRLPLMKSSAPDSGFRSSTLNPRRGTRSTSRDRVLEPPMMMYSTSEGGSCGLDVDRDAGSRWCRR